MALSVCYTQVDHQGRELIQHGSPLFPIACYDDDLTYNDVPWHWHDEFEAGVVLQGQLQLDTSGANYLLSPGMGFFVNSGILHGARNNQADADCRIHSVVFHPRLVGGSLDSIFWHHYLSPLLDSAAGKSLALTPEVPWQAQGIQAIQQAWQRCVEEGLGYEFQVREALSQLILLLVQHLEDPQQQPPSEKSLRDNQRMKAMLQYIQLHFAEPITVQQLAASALISPSECLRCFHSTIGTTPIQYVKELRIQKAAQLLRSTRLSVSQVAEQCGFQEKSYFARTFRACKGCLPSQYRQRETAQE